MKCIRCGVEIKEVDWYYEQKHCEKCWEETHCADCNEELGILDDTLCEKCLDW